jgi:transcriptional regulator GlxA family with amidase domain
MPRPRRIVVLVVPPIEELDLVGPVQVFSTATRLPRRGRPYTLEVVSSTSDRLIAGESGLAFLAPRQYREVQGEIDSLLLVSGVSTRNRRDDELAAWLRHTVPRCRRVGAVCISAFILAHAGVLTTQRVTVHWKYAHELAYRFPRLSVDPDPIWVQAGNIYTSGGFSAGIDLALAWVVEDCGNAVAAEAARELVLFVAEIGITRARYVRHLRVEAARRLLDSSSHDLRRIATAVGFGSAEGLRRAFVHVLGQPPQAMRGGKASLGV